MKIELNEDDFYEAVVAWYKKNTVCAKQSEMYDDDGCRQYTVTVDGVWLGDEAKPFNTIVEVECEGLEES